MMRIWATAGLLLGLAVVAALVAVEGYDSVVIGLTALGWGVALLPLSFLPTLVLMTLSWRLLFRSGKAPPLVDLVRAVWMSVSANALLPLGGISGDIVRVRVLMQDGVGGADSVASVILDKTIDAITLVVLGLIGIAFLVAMDADSKIIAGALAAAALFAFGIAVFIVIQRIGSFGFLARRLSRTLVADAWANVVENAADLDAAIRWLYDRPGRLLLSGLLQLLSLLALSFELWLAIYLMGQTISLWDVIMLRSLVGALRGFAFFVPGGWGLQEGGFVVVGGMIGFPPDFMLALSLATRARELIVSTPGLLAWQHSEGHALWKRQTTRRRP